MCNFLAIFPFLWMLYPHFTLTRRRRQLYCMNTHRNQRLFQKTSPLFMRDNGAIQIPVPQGIKHTKFYPFPAELYKADNACFYCFKHNPTRRTDL